MPIRAFYNEIDPYCCAWISNLMDAGLVTPGTICDRSIVDLSPDDIAGYERVHFFAGIAGWDYALNLAGWGSASIWTGSCPCQPFSRAGKGDGAADPRHLWPAWFRLIRECRPYTLVGEQVSGIDGLAWLDLVHADLEACDYAVGAVTLPASGFGAPHGRHRIFWVADADGGTRGQGCANGSGRDHRGRAIKGAGPRGSGGAHECGCWDRNCWHRKYGSTFGLVADAEHGRCEARESSGAGPDTALSSGAAGDVEHADEQRREGIRLHVQPGQSRRGVPEAAGPSETGGMGDVGRGRECALDGVSEGPSAEPLRGFLGDPWADAEWLYCRDGKWRPAQPAHELLAHGFPADVGVLCPKGAFPRRANLLRGFGNAIVPAVAAAFVRAYMQEREG